ncbi:MAG TPA: NUDIX hydrolase, partial [Thermoplasmata archaeon]|nr:NUDIX hydrolase [Thermoplasmata archaeon]
RMAPDHEFPPHPVPAVGVIVFRDGEVLLVNRGAQPNKGRWSIPGGTLEIGETVEEAAARETLEETGVRVRADAVIDVGDFIEKAGDRVRWHYVLIDVLCSFVNGDPFPGSDAQDARFLPLSELGEYDLAPPALAVISKASGFRGRAER